MRSTWPALVAVVAVGTVIGISIGDLPASRAGEIDLSTVTTTSIVPPLDTTPPITIVVGPGPATTSPATTSPPTTAPTTTAPTSTSPTTAVSVTEASTPETAVPSTTEVPATTSVPTPASLLDRADVRVVLANGDGRFNLVGINADRILQLGYVAVDQTDVSESNRVDRTTIYFRDGFDDEAFRLAADLLVPTALLEPLGDRTATNDDANGDVIAVLGPDAVR